jgi:hypothetical protein
VQASRQAYFDTSREFKRLRAMYNRLLEKTEPLEKQSAYMLNLYKGLYNSNDPRWDEIRYYYYDFNSAYYAIRNSIWTVEIILRDHPGFNAKFKVIEEKKAEYTVWRLRGHVSGIVMRLIDCEDAYNEAKRIMKQPVPGAKPK